MGFIFVEPLTLPNAKLADPDKIGAAIAAVATVHEGRLHPADVVDAARDPKSVLHPHFEWRDAVAAEAFRLEQARTLIRSVCLLGEPFDEPPRAWLSIKDLDGQSYRPYGAVRQNVDLQLAVLKQARVDLAAFRRRYAQMAEICDGVKILEDKIGAKLDQHESASV